MAGFVIGALVAGAVAGVATAIVTGVPFAFAWAAFGSSLLLGGLSRAMAKNPQAQAPQFAAQGRLVNVRQPIAFWEVVIGEVRKGGVLTFRWISEDRSQYHMVLTLACHRCRGIDTVWVNDEEVPLDADGNATGKYAGYLRVLKSLGDESPQTQPFPALQSESNGAWTEAHKQYGHTKVYVKLTANPSLFPAGLPNLSFVMRGLVGTDRRTGASGLVINPVVALAHYFTDTEYGLQADFDTEIHGDDHDSAANSCDEAVLLAAATATFTADAATDEITLAAGAKRLLVGDGVRVSNSGGALPSGLSAATTYYVARVSATGVQVSTSLANALAGTVVNLADAGTGTHTLTYYDEPRYRANGVFLTSEQPKTIIERLLTAMAGTAVNLGDAWHFHAGVYHAPTITLSERDLAGESVVQAHVPMREGGNAVKGLFTNPNARWQPDDFPPITSAAYLSEDGGERRWSEIDLTGVVTSTTQAQRLAKIKLLRGRQPLTESATFRLRAWAAVPGRTVARTDAQYGWSAKPFEIQTSELALVDGGGAPALGVRHFLRETAAAVFDWATSEEQAQDIAPNTNLPDVGEVPAPGVPVVTEELYETRDGRGVAAKAVITCTASTYPFGAFYQFEFRADGATDWTVLPTTRSPVAEILDIAPGTYDFRAAAVGVTGAISDYATASDVEIVGLGARPAAPTGVSISVSGGFAMITLTQTAELDVLRGGRVLVRHTEATSAQAWEESLSIGNAEGYPGDSAFLVLPLKAGTYLLKYRDASGQESESFATALTKQASILAYTPLSTVTEDPGFSGTHDDTVVDGGAIELDVDGSGDVEPDGTYTFSAGFDFGAVSRVRLTGRLEALIFNVNDQIDDRIDPIDDWADFDGDSGGSECDAWLEFRETDDNPAGTPTWSAWKRIDAGEVTCWGVQCRLQMRSFDPAYNIALDTVEVVAEDL